MRRKDVPEARPLLCAPAQHSGWVGEAGWGGGELWPEPLPQTSIEPGTGPDACPAAAPGRLEDGAPSLTKEGGDGWPEALFAASTGRSLCCQGCQAQHAGEGPEIACRSLLAQHCGQGALGLAVLQARLPAPALLLQRVQVAAPGALPPGAWVTAGPFCPSGGPSTSGRWGRWPCSWASGRCRSPLR